jgi:hypothetical protein
MIGFIIIRHLFQINNLSLKLFENIDKLIGNVIINADSNFICTDNGWLCEFGYASNCLRYFEADTDYDIEISKTNKTGHFKVKFLLIFYPVHILSSALL